MSTVITRLMTASEFAQLPDSATHRELIRGEVLETMPTGGQHGPIQGVIFVLLWLWNKSRGAYITVETGYILARNPDTVRAPNVSYIRAERIPSTGIPRGFWEIAPDLAVEVVSPSETASEVQGKVNDYLAAGTSLIWIIYPDTQQVVVYTHDGLARTYGRDATLTFPDLLPDFSCTVAQLFGE